MANFLTSRGFDEAIARTAAEIGRGLDGEQKRRERAIEDGSKRDWRSMDTIALLLALSQMRGIVRGIPGEARVHLATILERNVRRAIEDTRKGLRFTFPALATMGLPDSLVDPFVDRVVTTTIGFWEQELERRAFEAAEAARRIVSNGIAEGKTSEQIGSAIAEELKTIGVGQDAAYWNVVSSAVEGQARSFAELSAMKRAGVKHFEVVAVLDERTTEFCRFMDGKILSVDVGLEGLRQAWESPERVREIRPWMRIGRDAEGRRTIEVPREGGSITIASIVRSGAGIAGDHGEFENGLDNEELDGLKIGPPPYHAYCRSTVRPA